MLIFFCPCLGFAGLDEVVLYSKDKACAIRYLTTNPIEGQTIYTNKKCTDGWVQGFATVEIDTPFQQAKETLTGFFMDGYWLGSIPARGHIQDRSNPQENVQALTFILDTNQQEDITYLAQLRSTRPENRVYSAFTGCPIFRLLVVVRNKNLFQNEAFQEKIATQAIRHAKRLCTDLETIAVFGATNLSARAPDILFQMQIDPKSGEKTIQPVSTDFDKTDVNHPIELRQETGEVLLSVDTSNKDLLIYYGQLPPLPSKKQDSAPPRLPLTSLNHLNVQSRLTNHPAQGRVIVHVQSIDLDGSAQVDIPQPVTLKYHPHLKIGWAIVQGSFYQNQMQISDIQSCQQEWCLDVP